MVLSHIHFDVLSFAIGVVTVALTTMGVVAEAVAFPVAIALLVCVALVRLTVQGPRTSA